MTSNKPAAVKQSETLGRCIFSSKHAAKAKNIGVPYHVFLEAPGQLEISVDRHDAGGSAAELTAIGDAKAQLRKRTFYGWACIVARNASLGSRIVCARPELDNPYHAVIVLPEKATEYREEQKTHALKLALAARWRSRD